MPTETPPGRGWTTRIRRGSGQQKPSHDPRTSQHNPQYVNYWAPLTRKRHQQEHRPQRPTESSNPTQHAKARTGDCPGFRKETTTRRNVTQGGTCGLVPPPPLSFPTPCRSPGGGGRHLVNPKFFVAAHCVVVWVTVLWGTATCIPCTHGGAFCLVSLKWNLTAQPCFPLGPDKCDG